MEYKILKARDSARLEQMVTDHLKDRFRPHGGLCVASDDKGFILIQAMVRTEKKAVVAFKPPTKAEVDAYCKENIIKIDSEAFINNHESKGWMIGKNKMKDWKAAVRTWARLQKEFNPELASQRSHNSVDENINADKEALRHIWEKMGFESEEQYNKRLFEQQIGSRLANLSD